MTENTKSPPIHPMIHGLRLGCGLTQCDFPLKNPCVCKKPTPWFYYEKNGDGHFPMDNCPSKTSVHRGFPNASHV
jgi:hypothetical protein